MMERIFHIIISSLGLRFFYYIINHVDHWVTYAVIYTMGTLAVITIITCSGIWFMNRSPEDVVRPIVTDQKHRMILVIDGVSAISCSVILYLGGFIYTSILVFLACILVLSLILKHIYYKPKEEDIPPVEEVDLSIVVDSWGDCKFKDFVAVLDTLDKEQTARVIYLISKTYGHNAGRMAAKFVCN